MFKNISNTHNSLNEKDKYTKNNKEENYRAVGKSKSNSSKYNTPDFISVRPIDNNYSENYRTKGSGKSSGHNKHLIYENFIINNLKKYNEEKYIINEEIYKDKKNINVCQKNVIDILHYLCEFTSSVQEYILKNDLDSIIIIKKIGLNKGINCSLFHKLLKNLLITGINFLINQELYNYIIKYKNYIYKILKICCFYLSTDIINILENKEIINNNKNNIHRLDKNYIHYIKDIEKDIINVYKTHIDNQNKNINNLKYYLEKSDNDKITYIFNILNINDNIIEKILNSRENIKKFIKGHLTFEHFDPKNFIGNYDISNFLIDNNNLLISKYSTEFLKKFGINIFKEIEKQSYIILINTLKKYIKIDDINKKLYIYIDKIKDEVKLLLYNYVKDNSSTAINYIFNISYEDIFNNLILNINNILQKDMKLPNTYEIIYLKDEKNIEEYNFQENLSKYLLLENFREIFYDNFLHVDNYIDVKIEKDDENKEENVEYIIKEYEENIKPDIQKLLIHHFKNKHDYEEFKNILGKYYDNPEVINIINKICFGCKKFCDGIHIMSMYHNKEE